MSIGKDKKVNYLNTFKYHHLNIYTVISYRDVGSEPSLAESVPTEGFKTIYRPKMGGVRFTELLDKVSAACPNVRFKFTSPHPKDFPDDLLYLMRERTNISNQIHMPAQSGSSRMLERMRRGYDREAYLSLVEKIRSIVPNVSLSSDFISGFCDESDQDHEDTLSLLDLVRYDQSFMVTNAYLYIYVFIT